MKRITLYTLRYQTELTSFAENIKDICTVEPSKNGFLVSWELTNTAPFANRLLEFLQNIALLENPIFKHSSKLKNIVGDLKEINEQELLSLNHYIKTNKEMNLEGYVAFRLTEYKEKLDSLLYSWIRKINRSK